MPANGREKGHERKETSEKFFYMYKGEVGGRWYKEDH